MPELGEWSVGPAAVRSRRPAQGVDLPPGTGGSLPGVGAWFGDYRDGGRCRESGPGSAAIETGIARAMRAVKPRDDL
eukprot:689005-Prorocentrum_minimum.AAC.1